VNEMQEDFLESDLSLLAITGIKDPLRPEIKGAIV
jgi:magnesium-transporting ATPase (P-type)